MAASKKTLWHLLEVFTQSSWTLSATREQEVWEVMLPNQEFFLCSTPGWWICTSLEWTLNKRIWVKREQMRGNRGQDGKRWMFWIIKGLEFLKGMSFKLRSFYDEVIAVLFKIMRNGEIPHWKKYVLEKDAHYGGNFVSFYLLQKLPINTFSCIFPEEKYRNRFEYLLQMHSPHKKY